MDEIEKIDRKLAGHSVNLNIARHDFDRERIAVIEKLMDELLDLRTVAMLANSTG